jgi:hypothetical protein
MALKNILSSEIKLILFIFTAVIVDKLHWIFVVRADKIKPLFTPKV